MKFFNSIKRELLQLWTYVHPIGGHGLIGVYQRTVVFSTWVLLLSTIISLILEAKESNSHWLEFIKNYSIGISCSALIVLVASIIQYKGEHQTQLSRLEKSLFTLLDILIKIARDSTLSESFYNKLLNAFDDYQKIAFHMYWFNLEKERLHIQIIKNTTKIWLTFRREEDPKQKRIIDTTLLIKCINDSCILMKNNLPNDANIFEYLKSIALPSQKGI